MMRRSSSLLVAAFLLGVAFLSRPGGVVEAVEVPQAGSFFSMQTSGPSAAATIGDWYSSSAAGAGSGSHYLLITVPCGWPSGTPLHIDLFSPEMNRVAGALNQTEEPRGAYDSTQFELYGPGAAIGPGYASPAPGSGIAGTLITYPPGAVGVPETWIRHATLDPVTCGDYVLRSATSDDDDNGWRVRVGTDDDTNPANLPPANSDNPDGMPGTNDEIVIGLGQITYQHDAGGIRCLTLFEYVNPGQVSITFHNFDMDGKTRVRYYGPSDAYDPSGLTGGTAGTLSGNGTWNGGAIARGGNTISSPESGWWRIVSCINNHNQFIQEAQDGPAAYVAQPPTPALTLSKDDGAPVATAGREVTYLLTIDNTASGAAAGAAKSVAVIDPVPSEMTFVRCAWIAPQTGSCGESAGVVTATLDDWLSAGQSAQVEVVFSVDSTASGTITNDASVTYADVLDNPYPTVLSTDADAINQPPTAMDDSATTDEGNGVRIDVLANDSDPDGSLDPASVAVVTGPVRGTLSLDPATGEITYTPEAGFSGSDSFVYEVCDDVGACTAATVVVTVVPAGTPGPTSAATPSLPAASSSPMVSATSGAESAKLPDTGTIRSQPTESAPGVDAGFVLILAAAVAASAARRTRYWR